MNNKQLSSSLILAGLLALAAGPTLAQSRAPAKAKAKAPAKVLRPAAAAGSQADPAYRAADAAYKAYDRRDYAAAISQAQEATRLAPANRAYWLLLVNALIAANRLQEADAALNQGLQAAGDDLAMRAQREPIRRAMAQAAGTAMYRALEAGNLPAATTSARAAVQLAPDNAAYRLILIEVLLRGEQFAEAERLASESVALLPDSVVPLAMRGYARQRQGRWPEAKADFDRALQQKGLTAAAQRNLRLVAADSALAAREPQRALDILQGLPDSDAAVAQRRAAASRLTLRVSAQPVPLTTASFPPPGVDCGAAESALTCALLPGQAGRDPAFDVAAAGYRALEARDYAQAADKAGQAVAISPANRDYQLLLLEAQLGAGRLADAEQAATAALALEPGDAALLAQRGSIRKRLGDDVGAAQDFNAALATGQLAPAAEVGVLADLGRKREARSRFAQLQADGQLRDTSGLDLAYLAARVGDDASANALFASADAAGKLPDSALQDSAYSALRAGKDSEAVSYFKRTIDAADTLKLKLEPQMVFDTRRAVADITREGGVIASLTYRVAPKPETTLPARGGRHHARRWRDRVADLPGRRQRGLRLRRDPRPGRQQDRAGWRRSLLAAVRLPQRPLCGSVRARLRDAVQPGRRSDRGRQPADRVGHPLEAVELTEHGAVAQPGVLARCAGRLAGPGRLFAGPRHRPAGRRRQLVDHPRRRRSGALLPAAANLWAGQRDGRQELPAGRRGQDGGVSARRGRGRIQLAVAGRQALGRGRAGRQPAPLVPRGQVRGAALVRGLLAAVPVPRGGRRAGQGPVPDLADLLLKVQACS
jgi:Flp pilus assembly protein TadD